MRDELLVTPVPSRFKGLLRNLLGLDGVFHLVEMAAAIYEEAYITATILGFSATLMFVSCWVLGERHYHH